MLIVDGTFLIYKSFFNAEKTKKKYQIDNEEKFIKIARNVFIKKIVSLLKQYNEDEIIFFFDSNGDSFRKQLLPYYQKKRQKKPEIVNIIKEEIYSFLDKVGFTFQISEGVEADDLIASYVKNNPNQRIKIYTGDKDLAALVNHNVEVLFEKHRFIRVINEKNFYLYFEVPPKLLFDYKSFVGDTSDNIKGIKIMPKQVVHLLLEFDSIEDFFNEGQCHHLFTKLLPKKDFLLRNKEVLTLKTDCEINIDDNKKSIYGIKMPVNIARKINWFN